MNDNRRTVYILEDRGNAIIMHWFHYVVAGLYGLSHLPKPVYFHTKLSESFHYETLELIKPDYIYVEDYRGCIAIPHHGAPLQGKFAVPSPYYGFVRELILTKNNLTITREPFRYVYISRSRSHMLNWAAGARRRQLMNEPDIVDQMRPIGFEVIFLEDYPLVEKIKIFQEAKVLVTPSGGALTMCFFANQKTKVVEICTTLTGEDMYDNLCTMLSIPTARYTAVETLDSNGIPTRPEFIGEYSLRIPNTPHFIEFITSLMA
jgi:hypothetical protein